MWSLRKPSQAHIQAFLADRQSDHFAYDEVGASRDGGPAGYDLDHYRVRLGEGAAAFSAACAALRQWRMFPRRWTEIRPAIPPLKPGAAVAVLACVFGVWWLNACRIVYVVDEMEPVHRFGFAYGTLPAHVERGEARYTIEWDKNDIVWYDIRAFTRPRY